jgi:hypothetical protein
MLFNPGEQRAGIVQAHVDARMFFQELDEWQIGILIGLFEHVAEIAHGLVCVYQQDEMEAFWHGDNFALNHHTVRRENSNSKDDKNAQ